MSNNFTTITVKLTKDEKAKISKEAKKLNLSVTEYIKYSLGIFQISDAISITIDKIIDKIIAEIAKKPKGERFCIPDFFSRNEWQALGKGLRLNLGKKFKAMINNKKILNVKYNKILSNHMAEYEKE